MADKISILAAKTQKAQNTTEFLRKSIKDEPFDKADTIIAIGGDGFMLETLHKIIDKSSYHKQKTYGINRGSYGFLLNHFDTQKDDISDILANAEPHILYPLQLTATDKNGKTHNAYAINEVSLFRRIAQIAKLKISIDGQVRLRELWCDGIILATPAGSTAYNYAAYGPIVPLDSRILCLTPLAPFRPPRWRGALLPHRSTVTIEVLESEKRPVSAVADNIEITDVVKIDMHLNRDIPLTLLFNPDADLKERVLSQQFSL